MINTVERLFMCLLATYIHSFLKCQVFCPHFDWVICSMLNYKIYIPKARGEVIRDSQRDERGS